MAGITRGFGKEIRNRHEAPLVRGSRATLTDLGMIDRLYNMECEDGHRVWSPEKDRWLGKPCGARIPGRFCLKLLREYFNINAVRPEEGVA